MMDAEEFNKYQVAITSQISKIRIMSDINTGLARVLVTQLDAVYTDLMLAYPSVKNQTEYLTQLINNTIKLNAVGKNNDERVANSIRSVTEMTLDGNIVNLYTLKQIADEQLNFLNAMIKLVEAKQNRIITMLGLMKLEANLVQ